MTKINNGVNGFKSMYPALSAENYQWFSGDPSTPSRRKSSVGITVRMTRELDVSSAGNTNRSSTTIFHARRFVIAAKRV